MIISIDGVEVFHLSDIEKKVIMHSVHPDVFKAHIAWKLYWVIVENKWKGRLESMKKEWIEKLEERYEFLPTNPHKLAQLIFDQDDYQDRLASDEATKEAAISKLIQQAPEGANEKELRAAMEAHLEANLEAERNTYKIPDRSHLV